MTILFLPAETSSGILIFLVLALVLGVSGGGYYIYGQRMLLKSRETELKSLAEKNDTLTEESAEKASQLEQKEQENIRLQATVADLQGNLDSLNQEIGRMKAELEQRQQELVESRLEKLNYELSPHAFKNTLNTIQGMAFRMHSATETLTELLNYMLYETKNNTVSLAQELTFIDQYIAMNDLMTPPWVKIEKNFNQVDREFAARMGIAPLITIYFAENAFKHAKQDGKDCFIKFSIRQAGENQVIYTVTNMRYLNAPQKKRSGVGSANLQQRLDLLYPGRYVLDAHPVDDLYVASLTLTLEPYENQMPDRG